MSQEAQEPPLEQVEQQGDGDGNTGKRPRNRTLQHSYWCFTLNNWTVEQRERLEHTLSHECDWWVFQEEEGETGTPHLQGTLKLKQRQRITQLKCWDNKIHWEATRCIKSSVAYCTKAESRVGAVYHHGIKGIPEQVQVQEPYGWQASVVERLEEAPHPRRIMWYWEPTGNVGKSTLCKWLVVKKNAIIVSGKSADIAHSLSKQERRAIRIVIIDCPRVAHDFINYAIIEQVKNGLLFSGKYDSQQVVFNTPHVIVFANQEPDYHKMSADRWDVRQIVVM